MQVEISQDSGKSCSWTSQTLNANTRNRSDPVQLQEMGSLFPGQQSFMDPHLCYSDSFYSFSTSTALLLPIPSPSTLYVSSLPNVLSLLIPCPSQGFSVLLSAALFFRFCSHHVINFPFPFLVQILEREWVWVVTTIPVWIECSHQVTFSCLGLCGSRNGVACPRSWLRLLPQLGHWLEWLLQKGNLAQQDRMTSQARYFLI